MASVGLRRQEEDETPPTPSATASATTATTDAATAMAGDAMAATAEAGTAAAADAGPSDGHMANCPTAAPGATVSLKDVEGGIEVSITGKDEAAAKEIKARMTKLVEADKHEADAGVKHDHAGSGHGIYGRCTIVMRNTKLTTADIPNGVKAMVIAKQQGRGRLGPPRDARPRQGSEDRRPPRARAPTRWRTARAPSKARRRS